MKKIKINSKENYSIYIDAGITRNLFTYIDDEYTNIYIVVDNKIELNNFLNSKYQNKIINILELEINEKEKNFITINSILEFFLVNNIKRKNSLIIGIGGGVLTDMVGFASSIYMRGIAVAYIPTTLLAMVDASIGSKTGIDYQNKKNFLGTFYDPKFILIDPEFLITLPTREINSGIAEVIKMFYLTSYYENKEIVNKKLALLSHFQQDYKNLDFTKIIYQSLLIKKFFVEKDIYDLGIRQFLNFGHTIGHALESYYNFEEYSHGEAIAIGMSYEFPNTNLIKLLEEFKLPTCLKKEINLQKLFDLMQYDKKNGIGNIKYITFLENKPVFKTIEEFIDFENIVKKRKEIEEIKK